MKTKSKSDESKEVIGIKEAEELQKAGWKLVDVKKIENSPEGLTQKKYKFRKE